jgi:hypothetical protein
VAKTSKSPLGTPVIRIDGSKGFFRDLAVPTGQIQTLRNENLNRETLPEAGLM